MESEINKTESGKRSTLMSLLIILLAFLIYYCVMVMLGPSIKLKEIRKKYSADQSGSDNVNGRIYSDSLWLALFKEKAFLQSKIAMAQTDSVSLSLNLADSTANLEISGVIVHSSRIKRIYTSKILRSDNEYAILSMISVPLTITRDYATIKKEPVMIKMAPKDTSEYKPDILPDTSGIEPVRYILQTDKGVSIYVYQEEKTKFRDKVGLFLFDLNYRLRRTIISFKSVILLKAPEYQPFIRVKLPRADAKILYRAIPRKGHVAVYL